MDGNFLTILQISLSSLIGFVNISLGIFFAINWGISTRKEKISVLWFACISILSGVWAIAVATPDPQKALIFEPVTAYLSSGSLPLFFLLFTIAILNLQEQRYKIIRNILLLVGCGVLVYISIPEVGVLTYSQNSYPVVRLGSFAYSVFGVYLVTYFMVSISLLIWGIRTQVSKRRQLSLILAGVSFAIIWAMVFNFILILIEDRPIFTRIGPFGLLVMNGVISYLILKQKLFSIKKLFFELFLILLLVLAVPFFEFSHIRYGIRDGLDTSRLILIIGLVGLVGVLIQTIWTSMGLLLNLQHTNQNLQQELDSKKIFLQVSSHQLRTPLSVIKGYVEKIEDYSLNTNVHTVLKKATALTDSLSSIISDLLSINSVSSGAFNLGITHQVDMRNLVNTIVQEKEFMIDQTSTKVRVHEKGKNFMAEVDKVKIEQSLANIFENGLLYGGGMVDIYVMSQRTAVEIRIKDQGIGVSQDKIEWIFHKYTRDESATNIRANGSGIGLYIAKMIIEKHNGSIDVNSGGKDKGSEFVIRIPKT